MNDNTSCEMPDSNPVSEEIKQILKSTNTIAIVGLSDNPNRDSYKVAAYLMEKGYRVIPVNPAKKEILGHKCFPNLKSLPEKVDIVDIFRKVEFIPDIVEETISIGAKTVWMQLGLAHNESAQKARNAGLFVVQSQCIKVEHAKLFA